jgi:simple sugar transport system permease protein
MTLRASRQHLPVLATLAVLVVLYVVASLRFENFATLRVFMNFLGDNAFLGIVAVGATYVIITGGIDLSVGAVVGCTTICTAVLIQGQKFHPLAAFAVVIAGGTLLGATQGWLIQRFNLQPFLVTLAGLFFCRGIGLWISSESVQAEHGFFDTMYKLRIPVGDGVWLPFTAIVFLTVLLVAAYVLRHTRFGRTVYAIGGDEQSAHLMGLPVARTKIGVYALSGFCAALGGVVFVMYTSAGNAINGTGLELDAIAAVVIGGTLLTGGYGSVFGTFFGLLIFAVMQSAITFEGTLSSWWAKIVTGVLLLAFILMQRILHRRA